MGRKTKADVWRGLGGKARAAMRQAVSKWMDMLYGEKQTFCPLCNLGPGTRGCLNDCPIGIYTEKLDCAGTPFENDWCGIGCSCGSTIRCRKCFKAAQKEVRFLAGFLPKDDPLQPHIRIALAREWEPID